MERPEEVHPIGTRLKHGLVLSASTYGGALLGFFTQALVFHKIGIGTELDAYYAASALPAAVTMTLTNAGRNLLIPLFSRLASDAFGLGRLLSALLVWSLGIGSVLAVLLHVFRTSVVGILVPGFAPETVEKTVHLFSWFLLTVPVSITVNALQCLLISRELFSVHSRALLIQPLVILFSAAGLLESLGVMALVAGNVTALIAQGIYVAHQARHRCSVRFRLCMFHSSLNSLLHDCLPIITSTFANRSTLLLEKVFSSYLGPGAVTVIELGRKLSGVAGQAVTNMNIVAFPELSRSGQSKDFARLGEIARENQRTTFVGFLLLLVAFLAIAEPFVSLITGDNFQQSTFSATATVPILAAYFLVSCGAALAGTMTYCFYACGTTKPVAFAVVTSMIIMGFSGWLLTPVFGVYGLAVSALLQHLFVFVFLVMRSKRAFSFKLAGRDIVSTYVRPTAVALITIVLSFAVRAGVIRVFEPPQHVVGWLFPGVVLTCLLLVLRVLPLAEVKLLLRRIRDR